MDISKVCPGIKQDLTFYLFIYLSLSNLHASHVRMNE